MKAAAFDSNGMTIAEKLIEQTGVIGEKIDISACAAVKAPFVYAYNHPGNKVASIVGLNKAGFENAAKDVAMQIAAMGPVALNKESVPQSVIDKELEIGKELAIQEGKPADMAEKIAAWSPEQVLQGEHLARPGVHQGQQAERGAVPQVTGQGPYRNGLQASLVDRLISMQSEGTAP